MAQLNVCHSGFVSCGTGKWEPSDRDTHHSRLCPQRRMIDRRVVKLTELTRNSRLIRVSILNGLGSIRLTYARRDKIAVDSSRRDGTVVNLILYSAFLLYERHNNTEQTKPALYRLIGLIREILKDCHNDQHLPVVVRERIGKLKIEGN